MAGFDDLSSFDRINLGATILQSAVIAGFAVALVGVYAVHRRPAMRSVAVYWGLFAAAAIVNIFSSWSGAIWRVRELSLLLTTCVVALHAAAIPWACHAMAALERERTPRPPRARSRRLGLGVWAVHGAVVAAWLAWMPGQRLGVVLSSRGLHLIVLATPAVLAWRRLRADAHPIQRARGGAVLLAASYSAFAVRAALDLGLGLGVGRPDLRPRVVLLAVVLSVLLVTAAGVLALLASAAEERDVLQRQAALLAQSRERLARVQRFESLGRLAGGVAHDFANVLQVIALSAQEARQVGEPTALAEELREIEQAAARGQSLARQLLGFARPSADRLQVLDAARHVERLRPLLERLAGRARLELALPDGEAPVRLEPSQFDQVILNLVVNARDAMPEASPEGGRIAIRVATDDGPSVRVVVEDSGSGIPPEVLPHIFEPFYTTKARDAGTGLGLSTLQSIVHQAGGEVLVQSRPGEGTRFEVVLPLVAGQGARAAV